MANHDLQLVDKHKKWFIFITLAFVCLVGVFYVAYKSENHDAKMNAFRPLVKYQDKLYGWDEDVQSLPKGIVCVGKVEKSYNTGTVAVKKEDADLTSNIIPLGAKLYQKSKDILYVEDGAAISKYVFIPWEG